MADDRGFEDNGFGRLGVAGEPPPPTAGRGLRTKLIVGAGIAAFLLVVAGGAFWLGWERHASSPAGLEAPPLIKAEDTPIKVSPDEPGGLDVPNRDKLVYKRLQGSGEKVGMERLMPDPEKPLPPPTLAEPPSPPPPSSLEAATPPAAGPAPEAPSAPPATAGKANGAAPPATTPPAAKTEKPADKAKEKPADKLAATAKPAAPPPKGAYSIQLLAARSPEEARAAWGKIKAANGDVLKGVTAGIARADLGERGTFYRLRAGPFDSEQKARAACGAMAARGTSCVVIKTGG